MTWIFAGTTLAAAMFALRYRLRWNRARNCNSNYAIALSIERNHSKDMIADLDAHRRLLATEGCRNLKTMLSRLEPAEKSQSGEVAVIGHSDRNPNLYFVVKTFLFDYDDPDDREFAVRCAEELIETIQNA